MALLFLFLVGCGKDAERSDAYGNFEAEETLISSEATGKLIYFSVEEGARLEAGQVVGQIDTSQIYWQIKQLEARRASVSSRSGSLVAQARVAEQERSAALTEKARIENMLRDKAAPQKSLDDINAKIAVIDRQIKSIESQNPSIIGEARAVEGQINQLKDLLTKSRIVNPISGVVLNKYARQYEIATPGKPLYKIAALDSITLRAYAPESLLHKIKLGGSATVLIDAGEGKFTSLRGRIEWISDRSEFTPKIIQTRDERVNMVYAFKIRVKNDGQIKIGMPGEVKFD